VWVNSTGNWPYFGNDTDRVAWLGLVVETIRFFEWRVPAFCQMTTHVHAIFEVPDDRLPEGMRHLNLAYSRGFNARHERAGCFVKKPYGSRRILDGRDLLGTYAYVVLNPVVEGMCPQPEDWRWSSYATTAGLSNDFPFVDPSPVLDELDGSIAALRRVVAGERERRLTIRAMSRYLVPGHGRDGHWLFA
jgi:REP element-mobilizing transposase RayT